MKITAEVLKKAAQLQYHIERAEEKLQQVKTWQRGILEVHIGSSKFDISDKLRQSMIEIVELDIRLRKQKLRNLGVDVT